MLSPTLARFAYALAQTADGNRPDLLEWVTSDFVEGLLALLAVSDQ